MRKFYWLVVTLKKVVYTCKNFIDNEFFFRKMGYVKIKELFKCKEG